MNLLVVGASHHTADLAVLERLAVAGADLPDALAHLVRRPHVAEAVVLSTCNRVEFYAGVTSFHGGLADVSGALAERAGMDPTTLAPHLYVRWDADAVRHALRVAAGLDSMVVGETQVLGQLRAAYAAATEADTVGRLLHDLMQQALRVGKRVHAETGIGTAGRSVVTAALELAAARLAGADPDGGAGLRGRPALVIGAGAMGSLAVATLARVGATPLVVANRDPGRAARLARSYGGRAAPLSQVGELLPTVDVVVSATASTGQMLTAGTAADALATRPAGRPLVVCDLAVPRDVDPAVARLPGVHLIDTDHLASTDGVATDAVEAAEGIVAAELEAVCRSLRDARVAPTVAAL
ncbi:MAG TPA: glutamyl-tRNA reductase, partial [Natronosporangium sp.]|nr:glutamyl-tRNA reductase [Natronosporangium sp.]